MDTYFDEIISHLNRKKPILTQPTNKDAVWSISKPVIEISDNGNVLCVYYGKHYMAIRYVEDSAFNPYKISIETQCVFAHRQEIGTRFYEDTAPTQADVIECIRYRLRK